MDKKQLTVVGSASCHQCRELRDLLKGANIRFHYKGIEDVRRDDVLYTEYQREVSRVSSDKKVHLPAAYIDGPQGRRWISSHGKEDVRGMVADIRNALR